MFLKLYNDIVSIYISPLQCKSHFINCIHESITFAFNPQQKDPRLRFCNQTGTKCIFPSFYLHIVMEHLECGKAAHRRDRRQGGRGRDEYEKSNKSKQMDINFTDTALCQNVNQ